MRYQPLPAGPFDPREFGRPAFAPGSQGVPSPHEWRFAAGGDRPRRRLFRETMLAMTEQNGSDAGEHGEHGAHGEGRGRRRRGGYRGMAGPGFGGVGFAGSGGFAGGYGRGPKAGRGDIRAGILVLLAEQPRHGYEIIGELAERSGGAWRASPGSIYPTLKRLAHEGLVRADKGDGRRVFELTDSGRTYVEEHADQLAAPWDALADDVDDTFVQLRDLTTQVAAAVMQVGQAGTPEQASAAAALLTETRRGLYRILAEEPPSPGMA